jgi:hypothetical protein
VVLSRTRVVVLVGMVLALGIGLLGAVSAASPKDSDDGQNNGDKGRSSTLTVLSKSRQIEVVDLGPQGASHGDIRTINATLYNQSGKQKVGRFDLFAVMTDPADEPNEKVHRVEATYTFTLPGGEITAQDVGYIDKLSGLPPTRGVGALTGGTGKYADVGGEQRYERRGTKIIHTLRLID